MRYFCGLCNKQLTALQAKKHVCTRSFSEAFWSQPEPLEEEPEVEEWETEEDAYRSE